MKDLFETIFGVGVGLIGCAIYFLFYCAMFALMLVVGFKILSWIF